MRRASPCPSRCWCTAGGCSRAARRCRRAPARRVNPLDLVDRFGVDAFRYFLIREMNVGQDSEFSRELFLSRYNSDLANDLGNLVNRTLNMAGRYAGGVVPAAGGRRGARARTAGAVGTDARRGHPALRGIPVPRGARAHVRPSSRRSTRYVEKRAPWKLAQVRRAGRPGAAAHLAGHHDRGAAAGVTLLAPVMPGTTAKVNAALGHAPAPKWSDELQWGAV